ncbi:DUF6338 family protein [Oceanobacillus sp. FSL W7-1293]|uniref:DUF6338 family protein n=1 Tax=Oceanobacillus sp. FSL W7-1293 TaxID=2921699 RepID=UPI0030CA9EDE
MDEFLTLIIFLLPGLVSFNLLKLFGLYPNIKHQNNELLLISSIMWIPINVLVLGFYTLVAYTGKTYGLFSIPYVYNFETLNNLSNHFLFILYYVLFSILTAYALAVTISGDMYKVLLDKINNERNNNGKASLSRDPTVWENSFSGTDAQIVRIIIEDRIYIGELKTVSTEIEKEKDILLRYTGWWTEIMNAYEVEVDNVYVDTRSNIIIEIYDRGQCLKAQDLYRKDNNIN